MVLNKNIIREPEPNLRQAYFQHDHSGNDRQTLSDIYKWQVDNCRYSQWYSTLTVPNDNKHFRSAASSAHVIIWSDFSWASLIGWAFLMTKGLKKKICSFVMTRELHHALKTAKEYIVTLMFSRNIYVRRGTFPITVSVNVLLLSTTA